MIAADHSLCDTAIAHTDAVLALVDVLRASREPLGTTDRLALPRLMRQHGITPFPILSPHAPCRAWGHFGVLAGVYCHTRHVPHRTKLLLLDTAPLYFRADREHSPAHSGGKNG